MTLSPLRNPCTSELSIPPSSYSQVEINGWMSDRHLGAYLDDAPCRNLEIVCGIVCHARKHDEQVILPTRHPRPGRGLERAARQKERCRHDIEGPAELACNGKGAGHVGSFHEPEAQGHPGEGLSYRLNCHPFGAIDPRGLLGLDGENHVVLMQDLVVLETMHQGGGCAFRRAGEKYRGAGDAH